MGVAGRLSRTVSPFRAEQGNSLETPSRARASSCQEVGTTWFFSSCGGILELRRGSQASSWVGPGKHNLPLELRGKAGGCARVTAGPKRPHLPFPSPGDLPNPGTEPGSPALQADSLPSELPGKPNQCFKMDPLGLALGSTIFPSSCEGKLGVALGSLQGRRDLT